MSTDFYVEVLFISAILGLLPALIAKSKGRDFLTWWIYGSFLFLISLIHSLFMSEDQSAKDERALASGRSMKCPFCAEVIKAEAVVCRHCQRDIPEDKRQKYEKSEEYLNMHAGKFIDGGTKWVCHCGTANSYDKTEKYQNCTECKRSRDFVLNNKPQ